MGFWLCSTAARMRRVNRSAEERFEFVGDSDEMESGGLPRLELDK